MLFFENIDISFRPELDKIGIMFKKGNTETQEGLEGVI